MKIDSVTRTLRTLRWFPVIALGVLVAGVVVCLTGHPYTGGVLLFAALVLAVLAIVEVVS